METLESVFSVINSITDKHVKTQLPNKSNTPVINVKPQTPNYRVELSSDIYTCQQFVAAVKDIIQFQYKWISFSNFQDFNYQRKYNIISDRFSIDICRAEFEDNLSHSSIRGEGAKWCIGNECAFLSSNYFSSQNSIMVNGYNARGLAFNYFIPNKEKRNKNLKEMTEKDKTQEPIVTDIVDPLNAAKL